MAIQQRTVFVTSDEKSFTDRAQAELHESRLLLMQQFGDFGIEPLTLVRHIEAHRAQITAHFKAVDQLTAESGRRRAEAASRPATPPATLPADQSVAPANSSAGQEATAATPVRDESSRRPAVASDSSRQRPASAPTNDSSGRRPAVASGGESAPAAPQRNDRPISPVRGSGGPAGDMTTMASDMDGTATETVPAVEDDEPSGGGGSPSRRVRPLRRRRR